MNPEVEVEELESLDAKMSRVPRILLAEDDLQMRRLLLWALRTAGYQVVEAADGSDLLDTAEPLILNMCEPDSSPRFDLIVSDIRIPGFSGLELLSAIRSCGWTIPVILITAFGDEATHAEAERLNASAVLDKPFDIEDLIGEVRKVVGPAPDF
jgi:CheY-like chemotaxis protein